MSSRPETQGRPGSGPVVLINPRATYVNEIAQKCYPPLNLLYLAAALRAAGRSVEVIDANAFNLPDATISARLRDARPSLVGVPVYSEVIGQVRDLCRLVKDSWTDAKIVLGGPHAAAIPKTTLQQIPPADFILRGESEESLVRLANALCDGTSCADIPGICYLEGNGVHFGPTPQRPDIHALPIPARDLVADAYEQKRYYTLLVRDRPTESMITSRGCPFDCGFCYNVNFQYRARTPEDVMDELVRIRDRGIRNVEIVDDNFTVNRRRAMAIFDSIIREKLGMSFRIKSRVNVMTDELARKARQAGVYLISYGMESGSQRILDAMNKRIKVEDCARACEITKRNGMACHSSWIIGYPGETPETVWETARFVVGIKPSTANFGVMRPYPMTQAYELAKETGCLEGDWDPDSPCLPWVRLPWTRTRRDLDDLLARVMRYVYLRPYYVNEFSQSMLRSANWTLGKYAWQEGRKVLRPLLAPG